MLGQTGLGQVPGKDHTSPSLPNACLRTDFSEVKFCNSDASLHLIKGFSNLAGKVFPLIRANNTMVNEQPTEFIYNRI